MLVYYGYTVSPNQVETGEGFLICRNVPIARTGSQKYLGREINLSGSEADRIVTVHRSEEEVFSEAAMASFEGKPVTNGHPPDLIGPDDVEIYEKGHAQNIRRGTEEWRDYLLADLHIHNRELIDAVQGGKREISCGYECEYTVNEDGTYNQKNIRGNHVAVVGRGRAGKRAAILDSDTIKKQAGKRPERKEMKKRGLFFKLFGQAVKDKSPEEIEQMAMDAAEAFEEAEGDPKEAKEEKETKDKETKDEAVIDGIVDKVMARLAAKEAEKEKNTAKDSLDSAIEKLTADGAPVDGQASRVISAEETEKKGAMDRALALGILKAMRPTVAAIKDEAQRKAVSDALINLVTAKDERDDIASILQASQRKAQKAADKNTVAMDTETIQAMYDNLNPHRRKETK